MHARQGLRSPKEHGLLRQSLQNGIMEEHHLGVHVVGRDGEHDSLGEEGGVRVVVGKERQPHLIRKKYTNKKIYQIKNVKYGQD